MKPTLVYGLAGTGLVAVWTLAEFFLGWHGEHIEMGMKLGWMKTLVPILVVIFAVRGTRAAAADGGLTYGKGLVASIVSSLWYGLGVAVFSLLYTVAINPGFAEAVINFQLGEMAKKGLPSQAIEGAEKFMRIMMNPGIGFAMNVVGSLFWGLIVGLIVAAIFRREPQSQTPPVVPVA